MIADHPLHGQLVERLMGPQAGFSHSSCAPTAGPDHSTTFLLSCPSAGVIVRAFDHDVAARSCRAEVFPASLAGPDVAALAAVIDGLADLVSAARPIDMVEVLVPALDQFGPGPDHPADNTTRVGRFRRHCWVDGWKDVEVLRVRPSSGGPAPDAAPPAIDQLGGLITRPPTPTDLRHFALQASLDEEYRSQFFPDRPSVAESEILERCDAIDSCRVVAYASTGEIVGVGGGRYRSPLGQWVSCELALLPAFRRGLIAPIAVVLLCSEMLRAAEVSHVYLARYAIDPDDAMIRIADRYVPVAMAEPDRRVYQLDRDDVRRFGELLGRLVRKGSWT